MWSCIIYCLLSSLPLPSLLLSCSALLLVGAIGSGSFFSFFPFLSFFFFMFLFSFYFYFFDSLDVFLSFLVIKHDSGVRVPVFILFPAVAKPTT